MLIKLETILKSADESLQKTDEEIAVMDEDASYLLQGRSKAVYESACANFDEIKINFGLYLKKIVLRRRSSWNYRKKTLRPIRRRARNLYS